LLTSPEKIALQRLILAARPKKTIGCTKIPALSLAEKASKPATLPELPG
jgi:hypothetical protein